MLIITSNPSSKLKHKKRLPWFWIVVLILISPLALATAVINVDEKM